MNWSSEFIRLDKAIHDRSSFDCGEVELNDFIQKHAVRHTEIGINTTMVLPSPDALPNGKYPICAFYAIAPGAIVRENLPESYKKKLPRYPIPVFMIVQMAVHSSCQKQGLGKITLVSALKYLWDINRHMRAYAVIIDCLNENVEGFYLQYEFEMLFRAQGRARMFLPMKTVGMLFN